MSQSITAKLLDFNNTLDEGERANYKMLLGLAAGGLAPDSAVADEVENRAVFDIVGNCITGLQPYSHRISRNGVAWLGRPDFITDDLLNSLQAEARETRQSARDNTDHFLGYGGEIANTLALSEALQEFVRTYAGDVQPTGIASYIFYDRTGQGIAPHIDTDIFSLNVLLMLEHTRVDTSCSHLVLYPSEASPERFDLNPGDIIIMFAGSITHGREPIAKNEAVTILTFGFHPLG